MLISSPSYSNSFYLLSPSIHLYFSVTHIVVKNIKKKIKLMKI